MAAKVPLFTSTGGMDENNGIWGGVNPVTTALATVGKLRGSRNGLKLSVFPFFGAANDIDDGDTWASGLRNVVACAWQANQANTDKVGVSLTDAATGTFTFDVQNAGSVGWLWVLHGS